ncbi:hypothetical protein ABZW49_10125 [Nonomuraea wenchangensis]
MGAAAKVAGLAAVLAIGLPASLWLTTVSVPLAVVAMVVTGVLAVGCIVRLARGEQV